MTPAEEPVLRSAAVSAQDGECLEEASAGLEWREDTDDCVLEALEKRILDEDLRSPGDARERAFIENAARRLADWMLLHRLAECGFQGPLFEMTVTELAAYGIVVMMSWMRTGEISRQCRARGRPLRYPLPGPGQWSRDDRLELALETTARAVEFFTRKVLLPRQWDHSRGATLKTFFVGACVLQFPNEFSRWAAEQRQWEPVTGEEPDSAEAIAKIRPDASSSDPTCQAVITRHMALEAVAGIGDPRTRRAAVMVWGYGYSLAAAAAETGLSVRAVEGRLARLRKEEQS